MLARAGWWVASRFIASTLILALLPGCSTPQGNRRAHHKTPAFSLSPEDLEDPEVFENRVKASALFSTGLIKQYNDKADEALESFYQAAVIDPTHEPLVLDVASRLLLFRKDDPKDLARAMSLLEKAAASPKTTGRVHQYLALGYLKQANSDKAKQAYLNGIQRSPRLLSLYGGLASLHAHAKDLPEAIKVIDRAIDQPATEPAYWLELADILEGLARASGQEPASIRTPMTKVLAKVSRESLSDPALLNRLADRHKLIQNWEPAEQIYLTLLQQSSRSPGVREKLIDVYLRSGKKEEAARQLEAVGRENPTNPNVQFYLGRVFFSERNLARAQECFERTLLLDPDFFPVYFELTRLMLTQSNPKAALGFLSKARAREKFRPNFTTEFYSALVHSQLKDYAQALKHITEAEVIARANDGSANLSREFYYQYGSILERNGDRKEAVRIFRKALEISPDYAEALNYLGYMWAEKGENLVEAKDMIQRALKADPDNAAFLDSMGWVLFKLNQPKEALGYLLSSIQKSEEPDPTLFEHLGDVYAALGQRDKAKEAWKKSLELEPNPGITLKLQELQATSSPSP